MTSSPIVLFSVIFTNQKNPAVPNYRNLENHFQDLDMCYFEILIKAASFVEFLYHVSVGHDSFDVRDLTFCLKHWRQAIIEVVSA